MRWSLIDVSMIVVGLMCPWVFVGVPYVSAQARLFGVLSGGLYLGYGLCSASQVGGVFDSNLGTFGFASIVFVILAVALQDRWRGPPENYDDTFWPSLHLDTGGRGSCLGQRWSFRYDSGSGMSHLAFFAIRANIVRARSRVP